VIGVSPASFGGGTEFLFGITTQLTKFIVMLYHQKTLETGDRMKTFLIRGHQAGCGHMQYLKLMMKENIIIQPTHL
jgi:hypothetical protein